MDNLIHLTDIVKNLLEEKPSTRNSDYELYYEVCKIKNPLSLGLKFGTILRNREEYGIPSIESVGRARRKIVERYPDLSGNSSVESERRNNEEKFKEYARGCV